MARRPTAAQLRDKRARTLVIAFSVVFVIVLVIQGPKLLKMLSGSSAPVGGTVAGALPAGVNPSSSSAGTSSSTAATAVVADGQLSSLSRFAFKDPFHALVTLPTSSGSTSATTGSPAKPNDSPAAAAAAAIAPTVTFTATKTPPAPPNAAVVKTNGRRQVIFVGDDFPSKTPLFKLVALGKKNIRIGVLGGSFTSGVSTIKLAKGKRLTLANKADGSRYVLQLLRLTIATPPAAKVVGSSSITVTPAPATTTATTTPTTTATTTTSATPTATPAG